MGAINGALTAGNPPKQRIERLRSFRHRVSSGHQTYFDNLQNRIGLERYTARRRRIFPSE
jgi:hypothetical protein